MYQNDKYYQQLQFLKKYIYANFQTVTTLFLAEDKRAKILSLPANLAWKSIDIGDTWQGRDRYFWLKAQVKVPVLSADQHFILHLDLGRTGNGNNSGFESLLFVNGDPYQAIDSNHQDAYFDSQFSEQLLEITILLWTGLEGGGAHQIQHYALKDISAGVLNQTIRQCYVYLKLFYEIINELDEDEPLKYEYQRLLDWSLHQFDWGAMSAENIGYYCQKINQNVRQFIDAHQGEKKRFKISAIGHTHIDVAWLWRLKHTREKTARSFATVLRLMSEYPDYQFFHSTPQVYQFIKQDYPALYEQIKKRIKEGRWEADGATWVEPDMNIPSGEALTRQFLYGSRFFEKEFNVKQTVLWLPDVFGYSWSLPQIMKGFGIDNFMTTKISWNDTNRMPHDTFSWKGLDGTGVLTHFITTIDSQSDYRNPNNWMYTYNGDITPHTVFGSYHVYADKALNHDLLLAYGHGDGGGGSTREMIENISVLNKLPGLPVIENTRVDDYFRHLRQNIKRSRVSLPVWDGELYLEFHRGTYTSQARVKQQNRQLELAMRNLELSYVRALIERGIDYPHHELNSIWQLILRNQFHDILPGSAIHEVYQDNQKEYQDAFERIAALNNAIEQVIETSSDHYTIRNNNAWTYTDYVMIPEKRSGIFVGVGDERLNSQKIESGYMVQITVPALQSVNIEFCPKSSQESTIPDVIETKNRLENENYRIIWNSQGQLISIYDKHYQHEILSSHNGLGNVLSVYEDRPLEYNNWNIDRDYDEKSMVLKANRIRIIDGPFLKVAIFDYTYRDSKIQQKLIMKHDSRRIDFKTSINWHEHEYLLRTDFNTSVRATEATFDIQYGNVKRSTTNNTSWEAAKFETVAHKWADLSQHDYGVALLNDAKYGYNAKDGHLSLSLLKSGIYPDTDADQGHHQFTYSLLPHKGDFVQGNIEQEAMELNNHLVVRHGKELMTEPILAFEAKHPVALDAVKLSEDQKYFIIRLHEYAGEDQKIVLQPNFPFKSVHWARLDEKVLEPISIQNKRIVLQLKPYQIATVAFLR